MAETSNPPTADERAAYIATAAIMIGLPVDPGWVDNVSDNLAVLSAAAARVSAFPLPDEAEPAPVFGA